VKNRQRVEEEWRKSGGRLDKEWRKTGPRVEEDWRRGYKQPGTSNCNRREDLPKGSNKLLFYLF
jgi:hypothetical protein